MLKGAQPGILHTLLALALLLGLALFFLAVRPAAAQTHGTTFNLFVIDQNVVYGGGTVNVTVTDIVTLVINDDDNLGFGESYAPLGSAQETNGPATIVSATSALGTDYSGWVGKAFVGTDTGWLGTVSGQTVQLYDGWVATPALNGSYTTLSYGGLGLSAGATYGRSFWFDISTPPSSVPQIGDTISYTGQFNKDRPGEVHPAAALNIAAPTISQPASDPAAISIPENTTVITTVVASGADAAKFTIDPNTGALSFSVAPDYEAPTDSGGNNVYEVTVRAGNSAGTDDQAIAVTATTTEGVLAMTGNNAIVDWVLVEVRDTTTPATVVARQSALLQRDGDVVAVDGTSTLTFTLAAGNYHVAVKHRNHLGVMTSAPVAISAATPLVDFTVSTDYGTYGQAMVGSVSALWMGNTSGDNRVIGAGPTNDRNAILAEALAAPGNANHNANYIVTAYSNGDVNLDGRVIAAGPGNDINFILYNVFVHPGNGSAAANFVVQGQLP